MAAPPNYLLPRDAVKLVRAALKPKTPAARMTAAAKVIASLHRIAHHPDLAWSAFVDQYLRDCLATGAHGKALVFLATPRFSGNDMKRLLVPAVELYVRLRMPRPALAWIETVRYVFGARALGPLMTNPELRAFTKTKSFLRLAGPGASQTIWKHDLQEIVSMWKRDGYDNLKDALFDAKTLRKEAVRLGPTQIAAADKHLRVVIRAIERAIKEEPELRSYLRGLV